MDNLPPIHDRIFDEAVKRLTVCYRRSVSEAMAMIPNPQRKAMAELRLDVLTEMFTQIKTDASILMITNANDISRLNETYFQNADYGALLRSFTFEIAAYFGKSNMDHLAHHLASAFCLAHTGPINQSISFDTGALSETLSRNPWLIILLMTSFCWIVDTPSESI